MSETEVPKTEEDSNEPIQNETNEVLKEPSQNAISEVVKEPSQTEVHEKLKEESDGKVNENVSENPQDNTTDNIEENKPIDDIPEKKLSQDLVETHPDIKGNEIVEVEDIPEKKLSQDLVETHSQSETSIDRTSMIEEEFQNEGKEQELDMEEQESIEAHPLDELTDQQVIDIVNDVEMECKHIQLENILFESFLKENDPSQLDGMDDIMNYLNRKVTLDTHEKTPHSMDKQRLRLDSYTSITSIAEGKGPKINLSQKTDMVMRAMEESQSSLQAFLKRSHITKRNLKSELEEFSIRESEIKEAMDIFEFNVVTQGYDQLTQRIPAEKFIRYMEEWLKSAQLQIEKLRLRIATLKVQYKKVSQQLIQRQELGENVHAVDFDQLEIENKHFIEKIEQKNIHLIELKKMNGGANLVLSTHKKYLQKQQEYCNKLNFEIEEKGKLIQVAEEEFRNAEEELKEVFQKYVHCKNLKNKYTVPDVMDYVKLKGQLHELRKNIKIWVRRRKIQDIALNTCLREMKNLTGNANIHPSWFEDNASIDESELSSDDILL